MSYKLQTVRGFARMANLCQKRRILNLFNQPQRSHEKQRKRQLSTLITFIVVGLFAVFNNPTAQGQSFDEVQKIVASDRGLYHYFGYSVSISGDYAIVGANQASSGSTLANAGSAYIFEKGSNGTWTQVQRIFASDRGANDNFGHSVSISGDYAIVSAHREDEDVSGGNTLASAGSAYIFERGSNGTWTEVQKIVASDRGVNDFFGFAVSISGDYVIVSAYIDSEDASGGNTLASAGSAYIFERGSNGTWTEVQKIVASDRGIGDLFGNKVSISNNYAIVSAFWEDENSSGGDSLTRAGSAYIFERGSNGTWTEVQKVVASDRGANDEFGSDISISGDYAIVGANRENDDVNGLNTLENSGSAYIFERGSNGTWTEVQKIVASDREIYDRFGHSVSISGNSVIVGANHESHDANGLNTLLRSGSAYIFERGSNGTWTEVQKIAASDREIYDEFGSDVSISGNYAIVGVHLEDDNANGIGTINSSGSAYMFEILPNIEFNAPEICSDATEWLVPIDVSAVTSDMGSFSLVFDYDVSKMTYHSIDSANASLNVASNPILVTDNNGKVTISWSSMTAAAISDGTLMTLKFVPASSASNFSAAGGQMMSFTWDETVVGNCQLVDDTGIVLNSRFNNQTGVMVNIAPILGLTSSATNNTALCVGDNVTFTASGSTSYEFSLTSGGITTIAQANSATATYSTATLQNGDVVTVTTTNANGCSVVKDLTMVVNPLPIASLVSDNTNNIVCVSNTITFTASGGSTYEFLVDSGSGYSTVQLASTDSTYNTNTLSDGDKVKAVVTTSSGCISETSEIIVTVINAPSTAGLTSDASANTLCASDNVTFTATGGISYEFSLTRGGITTIAQANSATATYSTSTLQNGDVITVTTTNASGCSATDDLTMVVNTLPTAGLTSDASLNTTLCAGDNVTFTATGGTSYEFSLTSGGITTIAQANSATATYSTSTLQNGDVITVTTTNASGCSATDDLTMVVNTLPTAGLTSDASLNTTLCAGDNVTFTATGGTSYEFSLTSGGSTTIAQANSATSTYSTSTLQDGDVVTVTTTNANGCSATDDLTMVVNALPMAGLTSDKVNNTICLGETITFTATGGSTYEFLIDNGSGYTTAQSASTDATYDVINLSTGDKVKAIVTNANGCISESSEITVTVNGLPTSTLTSDDSDSRICQGQSVIFTASSISGADEFIFNSSIDGVVQAQSTTATYIDNGLQDGEVISVIGVNSVTGCQQITDTTLLMDVDACNSFSGNVVYFNGTKEPFSNVDIITTGTGLQPDTISTNPTDGSFSLDNLFSGVGYSFNYNSADIHGGANATDALEVLLDTSHAIYLFSLYARAADVNQDQMITGADASEIQSRFISNSIINYSGNKDWVFDLSFVSLFGSLYNQEIHGLAMGDVNGSYHLNSDTIHTVNDELLTANDGDRMLIPVRIKQDENIGAMSLVMNFPSNAMTIHDVMLGDSTSIMNEVDGNELRAAWASLDNQNLVADDVLFYIDATIDDVAAYGASPMSFSQESELADSMANIIQQVMLSVPNVFVTNTNNIETARLGVRNFPNPFSSQMTIEYNLPATSDVSIQVFNALGQEIAQLVNETQQEGTQRTVWNADNNPAGVYFYTITVTEGSQSYKATKQVVLMK